MINFEQEVEAEYQHFVSEHRWFSLQLPSKWVQYGDEENTYAFTDITEWTGNFRITPIRFSENEKHAALNYVEEAYQNTISKNARKIKMGDHYCVSFMECIEEEELAIYYWLLEKNNFAFVFSFSTDSANVGTERNEVELGKIERMIMTIKTIV
jgi:hypothetical protein